MKRKIIYGLLAILISVGLWLYVVTVVNPEWEDTFYNIPVILENEEILHDRGLMLASDEDPTVTLKLSGNRADMIKLNASNITIRADLSRIYSAGEQTLNYSIVYPGDVPNNAFEIISQAPQQLTLSVVERKSKDVDVQVVFEGTVPEQYIAFKDKATLDYEKIAVVGPAEIIDRIATAQVKVELEGKTETISQQYSYVFCDVEGNAVESDWIKANTEQVQYTLKIQQWKEIKLRVDVISGGGIKQEDCTITQSMQVIQITGTEKLLAEVDDELLLGTIDLSLIEESQIIPFTIALPEGITNLSENDTVEVEVKIPTLATKEFFVSNIQAINAEGMNVTFSAAQKRVVIRGPQAYLNKLTAQDLMIRVDFTDAEAGMATFTAQVVVTNAQLADYLGALGAYDMAATVKLING